MITGLVEGFLLSSLLYPSKEQSFKPIRTKEGFEDMTEEELRNYIERAKDDRKL